MSIESLGVLLGKKDPTEEVSGQTIPAPVICHAWDEQAQTPPTTLPHTQAFLDVLFTLPLFKYDALADKQQPIKTLSTFILNENVKRSNLGVVPQQYIEALQQLDYMLPKLAYLSKLRSNVAVELTTIRHQFPLLYCWLNNEVHCLVNYDKYAQALQTHLFEPFSRFMLRANPAETLFKYVFSNDAVMRARLKCNLDSLEFESVRVLNPVLGLLYEKVNDPELTHPDVAALKALRKDKSLPAWQITLCSMLQESHRKMTTQHQVASLTDLFNYTPRVQVEETAKKSREADVAQLFDACVPVELKTKNRKTL